MSGKYSMEVDKGSVFRLIFTIKTNETPWNLTGYTAEMKIRKNSSTGAVLKTLNTTNGKIALGGTAGTVTITMSSSETDVLPVGRHVYDLELVSGGGEVNRVLEGRLLVNRGVTY